MTTPDAPRPESPGVVVGIALGLFLILGALLLSALPLPPPPDGGAWLQETFGVEGGAPFGFEPHRSERLATRQVVVFLSAPGGPPAEAPPDRPIQGLGGDGGFGGGDDGRRGRGGPSGRRGGGRSHGGGSHGGGDSKGEWRDWSQLAEVSPAPPVEIALTRYPPQTSAAVLSSQFGSVNFRDLKSIGGDGGSLPVDSGHLDWGDYEAAYARIRHFYEVGDEPTFHDSMRVNLTLGREATVLHLRWPRLVPGKIEDAQAVLAWLRPIEP